MNEREFFFDFIRFRSNAKRENETQVPTYSFLVHAILVYKYK